MTKHLSHKLGKNEISYKSVLRKYDKNNSRLCSFVKNNGLKINKPKKKHSQIKSVESKIILKGKKKKQIYPKRIWTAEEDVLLMSLVSTKKQTANWSEIANSFNGRMGKQCRERWFNHLDPSINKNEWTSEEYAKLIKLHSVYGNKWSLIAKYLPGRTDNNIKNTWNTNFWKFHSEDNKIINKSVATFDDSNEIQSSYENSSIANFKKNLLPQNSTISPHLSSKSEMSVNLGSTNTNQNKFKKIEKFGLSSHIQRCSFQKSENLFSAASQLSIVFPIFNRGMLSQSFDGFSSFEENKTMNKPIDSRNSLYE